MLVQLVRPLVRSQIQTLAQTPSAQSKLASMVAQWLGYLGVHAEVTQLATAGDLIQVSMKVGRPEQCNEAEWRQILDNLTEASEEATNGDTELIYEAMTPTQKGKVHRLLACVLQAANDNLVQDWEQTAPQLREIGLSDTMLAELRAAIRVPTPIELLVKDLEPEVASYALSKAIAIALIDKHINQAEDGALKTLLDAMHEQPAG